MFYVTACFKKVQICASAVCAALHVFIILFYFVYLVED